MSMITRILSSAALMVVLAPGCEPAIRAMMFSGHSTAHSSSQSHFKPAPSDARRYISPNRGGRDPSTPQ